jgi:hypothetical protein
MLNLMFTIQSLRRNGICVRATTYCTRLMLWQDTVCIGYGEYRTSCTWCREPSGRLETAGPPFCSKLPQHLSSTFPHLPFSSGRKCPEPIRSTSFLPGGRTQSVPMLVKAPRFRPFRMDLIGTDRKPMFRFRNFSIWTNINPSGS